MKTIEKAVQSEINIKKSQFICSLFPTKSKKESKDIIQKLNQQYHDATHNCTAYITNDGEGYDDNGEPGGTAGKPMINALRKNDLHNVTAVVTRYFGGIKLGTGGLVRAYSSSISQALKVATLTTVTTLQEYQIHFSYDLIGKIDHYFRTQNIEVIEQQYEEDVVYHFLVQEDISKDLMELTNGKIKIQYIQDIESECVI